MLKQRKWRLLAAALALIVLAPFASVLYAQRMNEQIAAPPLIPHPASWPGNEITLAYLGHATLWMNYLGVRVLTDPSLNSRVGLAFDSIFTIGPKRVVAPPLGPNDLQQLDVIIITHAHMDHLDIPSLKKLPKNAVVIACDQCSQLVKPLGFTDVRELKWGEQTSVNGLTVRAMGARHWGKRWPPFGGDYGFNSYVLEKDGKRMLLACDSAETDLFGELADNPPDIAAFSIGAYDPWIWNHANPEQVWSMFEQTHARWLVPIHWGTFKLSKEPMEEPLQRLIAAGGSQSDRIVIREIGQTWTMPQQAASHEASTQPSEVSATAGR